MVCRVFKKKNYQKSLDSPKALTSLSNMDTHSHSPNNLLLLQHPNNPCARNDGVLDQILHYMGRTCKLENDQMINSLKNNHNSPNMISHHHDLISERFVHLPRLESPSTLHSIPNNNSPFKPIINHNLNAYNSMEDILLENDKTPSSNWVVLDRLVASQLNGNDPNIATSSFDNDDMAYSSYPWPNFTAQTSPSPSSSDPLCHLSV